VKSPEEMAHLLLGDIFWGGVFCSIGKTQTQKRISKVNHKKNMKDFTLKFGGSGFLLG